MATEVVGECLDDERYVKVDPAWKAKIEYAKRVRAERQKARVGRPIQFKTGWPLCQLGESGRQLLLAIGDEVRAANGYED